MSYFCKPMNCSPPGSSVREVLQARILGWVVIFFSKGSSWPRDQSHICIVGSLWHLQEDSLLLSHQGSPRYKLLEVKTLLSHFVQCFFPKISSASKWHWSQQRDRGQGLQFFGWPHLISFPVISSPDAFFRRASGEGITSLRETSLQLTCAVCPVCCDKHSETPHARFCDAQECLFPLWL